MITKRIRKILPIFLVFVFLITAGPICKGTSKEVRQAMQPVNLVYWRVFDDDDSMREVINSYRALHPNISVTYRKFRYEEYEEKLLNALAEDRGPDIYSIPNTWVTEYETKILPMPKTTTLPYQKVVGTIKKETVIELATKPTMSLRTLQNDYIEQVYKDVVLDYKEDPKSASVEKIFALPLYTDNLALFYNRDILNASGIPESPRTWNEFLEQVKKITKIDADGKILQSAAAIGTAYNIERASDILSLIMMQTGTILADSRGRATFAAMPRNSSLEIPPGETALGFYTDFASPYKDAYTWNSTMPDSLEAFTTGRTAFFFGYSYHVEQIRNRAPKLNFAISKIPQAEGGDEVNFANYWVETVSRKTKAPNEAWDFLQFLSKAENVEKYLSNTKKPTALRALMSSQAEDLDLAVFISQALTSKSWYHGMDARAAEGVIEEMIERAVAGSQTLKEAIHWGQERVNQTMTK